MPELEVDGFWKKVIRFAQRVLGIGVADENDDAQ